MKLVVHYDNVNDYSKSSCNLTLFHVYLPAFGIHP